MPLLERPHVKAMQQEPDARRILTAYARAVREVGARIAPLHAVVQAAAGLDPSIRALAEEHRAQRAAVCASWPRPSPAAARSSQA